MEQKNPTLHILGDVMIRYLLTRKPQLKSTFFVDHDYDHLPLLLLPGFVSLD